MSVRSFDELLALLSSHLERQNTSFRRSIPAVERLIITLRYLATGHSFASLHFEFLVGKTTVNIVHDTCRDIWNVLRDLVLKKPTCEDWCKIAEVFWDQCNFPNCLRAIDGKHMRVVMPIGSGTKYFNCKKYFSFVLLAVADANYCFSYIDIGWYGSSSDSSIFQRSSFGRMLRENVLDLPQDCPLPGTNGPPMPLVYVWDEAFALSEQLLRPYSNRCLSEEKQIFNYRLIRARRVVECSFGILANKWRLLHTPMNLKLENAISAVKAACVLHIFVRIHDGYLFEDFLMHDLEGAQWSASRGTTNGATVREGFSSYFVCCWFCPLAAGCHCIMCHAFFILILFRCLMFNCIQMQNNRSLTQIIKKDN
ncbi:uncharacterized protein [Aquarana catesbeiana]|uniref:uncharacterized protein n=1 Tax=Aquarana catesbeiana TaxID=8400 RepID=UPI003CC9A72B